MVVENAERNLKWLKRFILFLMVHIIGFIVKVVEKVDLIKMGKPENKLAAKRQLKRLLQTPKKRHFGVETWVIDIVRDILFKYPELKEWFNNLIVELGESGNWWLEWKIRNF